MGTQQTRMFKIDWIMQNVRAAAIQDKILNEKEFIAGFNLFFGSTKATAIDILRDLEIMNKIVRDDGEIWTPEAFSKQARKEALEDSQKLLKDAKPAEEELKEGGLKNE